MKKRYKLEVDCANCAAKMETAIRKIDGVEGFGGGMGNISRGGKTKSWPSPPMNPGSTRSCRKWPRCAKRWSRTACFTCKPRRCL